METIKQGYGNSGTLVRVKHSAIKDAESTGHSYLFIETWGGTPGMIGGNFNYRIQRFNNLEEIFNPESLSSGKTFFDVKKGKTINKEDLVKQYVEQLTEKKRFALLNKMMVEYLMK